MLKHFKGASIAAINQM